MFTVSSTSYSPCNYFKKLMNTLGVKPSDCSAVAKVFYEHSLLFAANNKAIADKFHQYKNLPWTEKCKIGAIHGAQNLLVSFVIGVSLNLVLIWMPNGKEATGALPPLHQLVGSAVGEEILCRGIIQNCLAGSQKFATYIAPQRLQKNCVFKWCTSPSARIIAANTIFAACHLSNGGKYLNDKESLMQATHLMLQPMEGNLYETTGSIIAPIACHVTNNFLVGYLFHYYKQSLNHE